MMYFRLNSYFDCLPDVENRLKMNKDNCKCYYPPISGLEYTRDFIGTDMTNGRYGEVTIDKCTSCNSLWLHYFVEYEEFSRSGRWYRGLISQEDLKNITPENSVEYLKTVEWYIYGGSYFNSTGKIGSGKVNVDH